MDDLISRQDAIRIASGYCHPANIVKELEKLPSAQPDLEDIKNQALNCSAELLKLVALIGPHNKEV